jgi:hypothetical protein
MLLGFAVSLVLAGLVRADEQADLRAVIEKGITARGGADNLGKYKAATWKGKGKFYGLGDALDYTGDWSVQYPGQNRTVIEFEFNGMKFQRIGVVNGDKGWVKLNDNLEEMDKEALAEEKAQSYAGLVSNLLVLRDKNYQLAALGDAKVGDRPVVGICVSHKDRRDVSLFLDKETGLVLRSETRIKNMQTGQEETQEIVYGDYREVKGVKHAMKLTIKRDGRLFIEAEWSDYKPVEKLDDSVFAKP